MRISRTTSILAAAMLALALAACSREPQDWAQAQQADTAAAYQQFLQQHPGSSKAPQAQARIKQLAEDHDWQVAAAADTRDAYQQFLTQYPDSKYAQEARIRIENFAQAAAVAGTAVPGTAPGAPAGGTAAGGAGNAAGVAGAAAATGAVAAAAAQARAQTPESAATARPAKSAAHERGKSAAAAAGRKSSSSRTAQESAHRGAKAGAGSERYAQVGAFSSRARAVAEWKLLQKRFPAALRGLTPHYVAGRHAGRTVYRLQVATRSATAAQALCRSLKRHSQACVTVSG